MPLLSTSSGSLYCGTYQFSYRLVRQIRYADGVYDEVYSDWTLPTAPVYIFDKMDNVSAGDGKPFRQTDNRIVLNINPSAEEKLFYTHYEVAVLRRLDEAYAPPTEAFKYEAVPFPTTWPSRFEVNSNYEFFQIDINDIVVDKAPIASVKTLATKNSVLFAGNVNYRDLQINPTINKNGCETIKQDIGFPYKGTSAVKGYTDAMIAHKYVGHFRDEVYRYAVSYVDKYGNWSAPKVFNFSGATNNKAVDGIDWKYPSRSDQNFTIFNSSGNLEAIGLKISQLNNHPTWAIGFSVLRAKRRKNILFQTPLVSTRHIQPPRIPVQTTAAYPQTDVEVADYAGTLTPKEFYFPLNRHIKLRNDTSGECEFVTANDSDPENKVFMAFPPEMMYRSSQGITVDVYTEGQTQVLNLVDAVGLKMNKTNFDAGDATTPAAGDTRFTNTTATFFASEAWQYYYERGYAKTALSAIAPFTGKDYKINEFGMMENAQSKYTIRSTVDGLTVPSFGDYEGLQDSQATDVAPTNVRAAIMILNSHIPDPSHYAFTTETAPVKDDISFDLTNTAKRIANSLITSQKEQTLHTDESNVISVVFIGNVLANLSDARYGDETEYNEFIPTHFEVNGKMYSSYMFSSTEATTVAAGESLPLNINVWGGDCFISRHSFKVSTSIHRVCIALTSSDAKNWWGTEYDAVENNTNYDRPIALDGASQILQLFLESEVNSDVAERDAVTKGGASYELLEGGAYEISTPMNYFYMPLYSVPNGLKLYTSTGVLQRNSNVFPARVTFSNVKLLNTSTDGFELFNVADYYDLEGELGDITKLITFKGRLYSVQERGVAYIPVEAGVIESEDMNMLSISSGKMINTPQYLSSSYGSKHIKSVISTDNSIAFVDTNNKTVIRVTADGLSPIGDISVNSFFNAQFTNSVPVRDLFSFYDFNEKQLYIVRSYSNLGGFALIYNDNIGAWETPLQISQTNNIKSLTYLDGSIYGIGLSSSLDLEIHKLYTNSNSVWFGTNIVPSVTFVVNPNPTIASTFDLVVVDSSEKLSTLSMNIERDNESIDASTGDLSIDIDPRKGVYKVNELRNIINVGDYTTRTLDSVSQDRALRSGQRMKGTYALCTIKWPVTSSITRVLTSVVTKFRPTRGGI